MTELKVNVCMYTYHILSFGRNEKCTLGSGSWIACSKNKKKLPLLIRMWGKWEPVQNLMNSLSPESTLCAKIYKNNVVVG